MSRLQVTVYTALQGRFGHSSILVLDTQGERWICSAPVKYGPQVQLAMESGAHEVQIRLIEKGPPL